MTGTLEPAAGIAPADVVLVVVDVLGAGVIGVLAAIVVAELVAGVVGEVEPETGAVLIVPATMVPRR